MANSQFVGLAWACRDLARIAPSAISPSFFCLRLRQSPRSPVLAVRQFRALEMLMRSPGQVVRRRHVVDEVWGKGAWVEDNTLDVAIGSLRSAVDKGHSPRLIRTVRGFGYRLEVS
jgi:DNA-binding response OmpR family regulator